MSLVWSDNLVRNQNGKLLGRVCRPKLKIEKATSQHIIAFNDNTVGDIQNQHKRRQQMIYTVLGKK